MLMMHRGSFVVKLFSFLFGSHQKKISYLSSDTWKFNLFYTVEVKTIIFSSRNSARGSFSRLGISTFESCHFSLRVLLALYHFSLIARSDLETQHSSEITRQGEKPKREGDSPEWNGTSPSLSFLPPFLLLVILEPLHIGTAIRGRRA